MNAMVGKLLPQPIGPFVIGQIVDYVEREAERERELLSLRKWHVLHVMTGWESDVGKAIEDNGMAAYVPRVGRKRRLNALRHCTVRVPLYPGYLFAGFDPCGELWHTIKEMEGVIRLFMVDFHPIAIPWTVIARIQEIVAQWQDESEKRMMGTVQVGNAVRIVDHGGFTGLFGEVVEIDEVQRRVRIDLEIFKRVTPMWLAEGKFEVV